MSAKEANLLDELRKKELRSMMEKDYGAIRNQVENQGMGSLKGGYARTISAALRERNQSMEKATSVKVGDMVSWDSSGGTARGKVEHVMREGVLGVPKSKFSIKAEPDDPAVLIRIYRDDKETETLVGHKMSTLRKSIVEKHGSHDQKTHGAWATGGVAGATETDNTPRKISANDEGLTGTSKQGSVTTTPGVLDKLFGKGEIVQGDEFERKVTEVWAFEMKNPATGESFKADVYDWMRYDEMGLTAEQGQKLAPMGRNENGTFSVGTTSRENALVVENYILSNSK